MKSRQDYEEEITQLHHEIQEYKGTEAEARLQNRLRGQLHGWYDRLDITIFVANNEQLPWSEEEIGLPTRPMLPKKTTTFDQVGDYVFFVNGSKPFDQCFAGLVVERKTCQDLYGTLMNRDHRERLYREIQRFEDNHRFNQFRIFAECDIMEFLNYRPPNAPDDRPLINEKIGAIASLSARGAPIFFCGSRKAAATIYRSMVKQWVIKNYDKVIPGLDLPKCEPTTMSEVLA
ncbi:ERCC4 domain-containing protein [Methanococcoides sp. FTZ1]|uniref:ERCC4 domain-containing protein n=1 Tax=Methanococcoides sp. FTZ1 TaxID=3439061 RepID=UPI003F85E5E9